MQSDVNLEYTSEFKKNLKLLSKKYRNIRSDLQPLLDQIASRETPGDQIPHIKHVIYKARVRNRDTQKGKQGGYRVIYYLKQKDKVILVTIYSKLKQSDISVKKIQSILDNF